MSQHIADRAGFLAALAADDPERRVAEAHAGSCAACRGALREGHLLVALLGEVLPLPPPTPEALARTAASIEGECVIVRRNRRILTWAVVGAMAGAWVLQLLVSKRLTVTPARVMLSLGVLAAGVSLVRLAQLRGQFASRAFLALIGLSGVFALAVGKVPAFQPRIGIECTAYEIACAAVPWVVGLVIARRKGLDVGRWSVMSVAAGGALASHAAQHLACPVPHADLHLLLFHLGGVVLAGLLGAARPWSFGRVPVGHH
jgi:hypothetical protein